jgi:hypothetical protein
MVLLPMHLYFVNSAEEFHPHETLLTLIKLLLSLSSSIRCHISLFNTHKTLMKPTRLALQFREWSRRCNLYSRIMILGTVWMPKFLSKCYCSVFVVIWQILSNHGLIRLKRFVSSISSKLCN